jgi:hypothetical protein
LCLVRRFAPNRTVRQTAPQTIFLLPIPHSLARTLQAVAEELFSTAGDGRLADTSLTATGSICMTNALAAVGFRESQRRVFEQSLKSAKWTCNVGAPRRILLARRRWLSHTSSKKARRPLRISALSAAPLAAACVSHSDTRRRAFHELTRRSIIHVRSATPSRLRYEPVQTNS